MKSGALRAECGSSFRGWQSGRFEETGGVAYGTLRRRTNVSGSMLLPFHAS